MDKLIRLTADDRADLVAYLDGELDPEQTRRIEAILASNPVARAEVEQLAKTYELLDSLPRPKLGQDFTEKTVATARIEEFRVPLTQQPWFRQLKQYAGLGAWSLAMLGSTLAGFGLTRFWAERPTDVLLDHYPVIENIDAYNEAGSIEFLDALQADAKLLGELQSEVRRESP